MSKSPKAILRLSRRAAKSASTAASNQHAWLASEANIVTPWRRSLHLVSLSAQQGVSGPHPPWFDPNPSYSPSTSNHGTASSSSSSSSQQAKSGNPPQYSHHAILPCSELGPPLNGSEAYALTALQGSATNLPSNLAFLPIYQAPADLQASSSKGSSSKDARQQRRAAAGPQLCFGRNGAAGIPKNSHTLIPSIVGSSGEEHIASPSVLEQSVQVGEDAYFVRRDSMGVSDGVGGWSRHTGADSALFSRLLMHNCAAEFSRYEDVDDPLFLEYEHADPVSVLGRASKQCIEDALHRGVAGSSTALICVLRNNILRVANLGDCNVSIIRGTRYIFRSAEQQHSFNHPFQIGSSSKDSAERDAQRLDVRVQKGDIVILSSDGLIDNLYELDILEEVLKFSHPSFDARSHPLDATPIDADEADNLPHVDGAAKFSPQRLSEALCSRAKAVMMDPFVVASPFADRATEQGLYYSGGKKDDVTCLIGVVGEVEASEDRR